MTDSPAAVDGRWTPGVALARFRSVLAEEGARSLWFKLLGEAGYRRLTVFELPIAGLPASAGEESGGLVVTELAAGDRDAAERLIALNSVAEGPEIEHRLRDGHRCFLAQLDGASDPDPDPVAACWISGPSVPLPYLGLNAPMADDEACTFETWTDPAVRGQGIGPKLRLAVAALLAAEGKTRLLAMIYPENNPGVRMVEKLGYRPIGTLAAVGPASRRRPWMRIREGERPPGAPGGPS